MVVFTVLIDSIIISIAISVALTVAQMLLFPKKQAQQQQVDAPKPADGKINERQSVPSLTRVYGRVKKGGDYVMLEEAGGTAYHVIVWAGHRIQGFVTHYLHDEIVTLGGIYGDHVVSAPAHFGNAVKIETRNGLDAEIAWADAVAAFPSIWTTAHRGDGLAQLLMRVNTVNQEGFGSIFPQGMPLPTQVGDGALLYDPRDVGHDPHDPNTWAFSKNLALIRLDHLTHPSGGKLALADMYLPDWIVAANVCDETVTNKTGGSESRYHGGMWYYHSADPVDIGRKLDEAGELVVYTRTDGLIGVHAGSYVAPDIRITEDDMLGFSYAANRSAANTVLAVRGRFTDPDNVYNTADAAIWGDPYSTDDASQRTKTIDNVAVQSHNHMQRLQKLSFLRANAPRISLSIPYLADRASRRVAQRRFVRVHYPSRGLDEAVIEIINRPRLGLSKLTLSFEGIVVNDALYDFDALIEEGNPPPSATEIAGVGVPTPTGFAITIFLGAVAGGQTGAQAKASWDVVSAALNYELEYQLADESLPPSSVGSPGGQNIIQTPFLIAGAAYRFRLRAVSNGARSPWTSYVNKTAVADITPPATPTDFTISGITSTDATLSWTNPNSSNFFKTILYRGTSNVFSSAAAIHTSFGAANAPQSYVDGGFISGTFYWWVVALNASDVASTEAGSVTTTF